jgi:protein PhnA
MKALKTTSAIIELGEVPVNGMAKGLEKHRERQRKLSLFGKDLTRRSRSLCELCGDSGRKLSIFELEPVSEEPEYERCLFLCDHCREPLGKARSLEPDRWRFLKETIWSDIPVAQALAARILDALSRRESWAAEILEDAYLDEEVQALVREQSL